MMSFFKNKEQEKEKRKLEKKLNHSLNSSSINNQSTNESFMSNNNNNNDTTTATMSSTNNSSSVHHVTNPAAVASNGNKLNSSSRSSMEHSQSHQVPPVALVASGSATIVSNTQPAKPKKGILKTMSKFGIGPTLSNMSSISNSNSSLTSSTTSSQQSTAQQQQQLSALSTIVLSPKLTKTAPKITVTNRAHVNSITYSSSTARQVSNETTTSGPSNSHVSHSSLAAAAEFLHPHSVTFTLPKLNRLPYYLIHLDDLERTQCLMRSVRVPYKLLSRVSLRNETTLSTNINVKPPILVDVPVNLTNSTELGGFLPGDQLIEINDQVVIYKSLAECAKLIEKLTEEGAARGEHDLIFKVKTCLLNAELVVKNDANSIDAFSRHLIINAGNRDPTATTPASLKLEAGGFKPKNVNGLLNGIGSTTNSLSSNSSSSSSINSLENSFSGPANEYTTNSDLSNVWLTHANGYTQAKIFAKVVQKLDSSDTAASGGHQHHQIRYKIRLVDAGGSLIEVSEEHLEKANPSPQYDFCEDLSQLRFINESSLIHCLRQRYVTLRHIYTYLTGQSLLCLRPALSPASPLKSIGDSPADDMYKYVYSDRLVGLFKNCKQEDMPPHVYAYAQSVYRQMLTNRQDQSILMMGHSGSGKTQNTRLLLNYLFKVAASPTSASLNMFTEAKLNAMFCLLNAFCCIRSTDRFNTASNRFLNIFLLEFNHSGQLASLLLQLITFDHTRLVYQPQDETTFLVFEHLLHGAQMTTKRDLMLHDLTSTVVEDETFAHKLLRSMNKLGNHEEEINKAAFQRILDSLKVLNFDEAEIKSVMIILAAIVHLMLAGACRMSTSSQASTTPSSPAAAGVANQRIGQFKSPNDAHKAAQLLGITYNQLNEAVFCSLVGNAASSHGIGGPGGTSASSSSHNTPRHKYSHLSNNGSRLSPADTTSSLLSSNSNSSLTPIECLQGFCLGLYQECLSLIVNCINRTFKPPFNQNQAIANSMLLIDPPGFQAHKSSTNSTVASHSSRFHSHSDLMCNYMSERLQLMFYQINFIQPIERYTQEGLDNTDLVEHIPESPSALVNWLDRPPAPPNALLNSHHYLHHHSSYRQASSAACPASNTDNSCGLLWLMEEQIYSNEIKNTKQFHARLAESDPRQSFMTLNHAQTNGSKESEEDLPSSFTIYHQFGNQPIEYSLSEWLESYNREYITQRNALTLLQLSRKETISNTFINSSAMSNAAATLSSSLQSNLTTSSASAANQANLLLENAVSSASSSSLKRQASVRKMLTLSKRKSFVINFKLQIDSVFDSIRKTKPNFMFCLLPDRLSGVSEHHEPSDDINVAYLRSQLKAYQLLAACRIYRQGYPDFLNFEEFQRRYGMFLSLNDTTSSSALTSSTDLTKQSCLNIVRSLDLDPTYYKTGTTQIFFKAGVLARLESRRDEKINSFVVTLQANCRRYLAQKAFNRKRVQDSAIRCIQKNIRIWFALKKWKWWRLYTHLMPILNVQNSEVLVKQLHDELEETKRKLDRLINEKNELKIANNQLETKLMNLQTEYVEEHAANAGTIDLLEVESSERIRLEKELSEIRPLYNEAVKKLEQTESEMLELRLYNTKKSIEQELEKDDLDGLSSPVGVAAHSPSLPMHSASNGSDSTGGSDRLRRENEQLKKQLREEREQARKLNTNERAFFELKLKERDEEYVEMEKQCAIHKRKYQKLSEEVQDMQRMLDETKARNRELEKTQARFDSEMSSLKTKFEAEKELREKIERERDQSRFELFNAKSELEAQQMEKKYHSDKVEQLERDLKEYENAVGVSSNVTSSINMDPAAQLVKLKAQIRELDTKCKDQEEELDEQSCTIQQLEQAKLRLEMQLEKEKQKWQREIAEKESEMDDLRFHTQKKIKAIEMQLEEESELSNSLQREKRELERKMREIAMSSTSAMSGIHTANGGMNKSSPHDLTLVASLDYLNKLKRQMLKYKTLAHDAQTQLEKWRESMPKQQSMLKSLKSQLEDSEIAKTNALKSKHLLQVEVENLQQQLYESNMHRQNLEEQNIHLNHQLNNLKSELDEQERDTDDIMKKYHTHVQNFSLESHRYIELNNQIDMLTVENRLLKERLHEMEEKITHYETFWVEKSLMSKIESKLRDMENKLEFEQTQKNKFQNQLDRLKAQYDQGMNETESILTREKKCEDQLKKAQRANKEILEEYGEMKKKLIEQEETKKRVEKQNETLEKEIEALKMEIKVNQNRLEAFQLAFNSMNESDEENDPDDDDMDLDEDDDDVEDIDELIMTYNTTNQTGGGGGENGHHDMDDDDEDEELNYVEEEQLITTTKTNGSLETRNDYSINIKCSS